MKVPQWVTVLTWPIEVGGVPTLDAYAAPAGASADSGAVARLPGSRAGGHRHARHLEVMRRCRALRARVGKRLRADWPEYRVKDCGQWDAFGRRERAPDFVLTREGCAPWYVMAHVQAWNMTATETAFIAANRERCVIVHSLRECDRPSVRNACDDAGPQPDKYLRAQKGFANMALETYKRNVLINKETFRA